jgi:hypothetical protein
MNEPTPWKNPPQQDPNAPRVSEVHLCDEAVEISGLAAEEVFAEAAKWLGAQRQISDGWTVNNTGWHFQYDNIHGHPSEYGPMRYYLTLSLLRTHDDGRLPDGSKPAMIDRLIWNQ